jgi:hypothetical protein
MQSIEYKNLCPKKAHEILIVDVTILLLLIAGFPLFLKWNPKN